MSKSDRSACHDATVTIGGDDPESTHWYICSECNKPCDLIVMTSPKPDADGGPYHLNSCHSTQRWIKGMTEPFPCDCGLLDLIRKETEAAMLRQRAYDERLIAESYKKGYIDGGLKG